MICTCRYHLPEVVDCGHSYAIERQCKILMSLILCGYFLWNIRLHALWSSNLLQNRRNCCKEVGTLGFRGAVWARVGRQVLLWRR
jgi:hypothetical protein